MKRNKRIHSDDGVRKNGSLQRAKETVTKYPSFLAESLHLHGLLSPEGVAYFLLPPHGGALCVSNNMEVDPDCSTLI